MHYAKILKQEIEELKKANTTRIKAIWWAKTEVLGKEPGIRPFTALVGNEEGLPCMDVSSLRKTILDLP